MRQLLPTTRGYTLVILKRGPAYDPPRSDAIIWEHGRRNFALRAAGLLSIVCPVRDGTVLAGIDIFDAEPAAVEPLIRGDPAITAGVLTLRSACHSKLSGGRHADSQYLIACRLVRSRADERVGLTRARGRNLRPPCQSLRPRLASHRAVVLRRAPSATVCAGQGQRARAGGWHRAQFPALPARHPADRCRAE